MIDDDLNRFVEAQARVRPQVVAELTAGRKETHWIWFVFPQIAGLGHSFTAQRYAIGSLDAARRYLDHPVLGERLRECAEAVLAVEGRTATQILGSPDDLKLRSCATLFAAVAPAGSVFERLLTKYYDGEKDERTLRLLPS